ncbi:MAG: peroxide stress protein YaaA [Gammaproteobacteria bacterium]|nr:peroxide stress protein YaaA [Gammaproteobacteria bacterium]
MLIVISPAKTLDLKPNPIQKQSQPTLLEHSQQLNNRLRQLSALDISELMKVSSKIAELNFERNLAWQPPFDLNNAKQALLAFKGDVYTGLNVESFSADDLDYAQQHLRILSGLYGLLKPLDLMQAYRLEMGSRLSTSRGKNLYQFWDQIVTDELNSVFQTENEKEPLLINLASNEYFKVIKKSNLKAKIITPIFKEYKNGDYKIIGIYAKRARGLMSRFIIQNRIANAEQIKTFSHEGYAFNATLSSESEWVFSRNRTLD